MSLPSALLLSFAEGRPLLLDDDAAALASDTRCMHYGGSHGFARTEADLAAIAALVRPKFLNELFHSNVLSPNTTPRLCSAATGVNGPCFPRVNLEYLYIGTKNHAFWKNASMCHHIQPPSKSGRASDTRDGVHWHTNQTFLLDKHVALNASAPVLLSVGYGDDALRMILRHPVVSSHALAQLPIPVLRGCLTREVLRWPTPLLAGALAPYLVRMQHEYWIGIHLRAGDTHLTKNTLSAEQLKTVEAIGQRFHQVDKRLPSPDETWEILKNCLAAHPSETVDGRPVRYFLASDSAAHAAVIKAHLGDKVIVSEGTAVHSVYGHGGS
ncbi:MAG: hypothetical protein ACOVN2_03885, partial [Usitatibacteraceae bacterium]